MGVSSEKFDQDGAQNWQPYLCEMAERDGNVWLGEERIKGNSSMMLQK